MYHDIEEDSLIEYPDPVEYEDILSYRVTEYSMPHVTQLICRKVLGIPPSNFIRSECMPFCH